MKPNTNTPSSLAEPLKRSRPVSVESESNSRRGPKWLKASDTLRLAVISAQVTGAPIRNPTTSDDSVTPRFVASFTPTENSLYYLSISRGFRSAGVALFAASLPDPLNQIVTFEHDSVWNYEIGAKVSSASRKLTAEGAVYFTDWKNIQVPLDPAGPGFTIVNGSDGAHVFGLEGQLTWLTSLEGLQLSLSGSLIEAEYDGPDPAGVGAFVKGDRINDVPEWTLSAIVQYDLPIMASSGLNPYLRAEHSSRSDYIHVTRQVIESFRQTNLRAGLRSENGWAASIWLENVSDEVGVMALDNDISAFPIPAKPRTLGVSFSYDF